MIGNFDKDWLNYSRWVITCLKCIWVKLFRDVRVMKESNDVDVCFMIGALFIKAPLNQVVCPG